MGTARSVHASLLSVEAYLDLDADARDVRYEYDHGRIYALAGASPDHNLIKDNIRSELHPQMRKKGCRSFTSDQRVQVGARYVYPDVVVVCGDMDLTDETPPSLRNPDVLIEVTSPSTASRDYSDKLQAYMEIASLQEYWIVDSASVAVLRYVRHGDDWVVHPIHGRDAMLTSDALDVSLALDDVYALVEFEDGDEASVGHNADDDSGDAA